MGVLAMLNALPGIGRAGLYTGAFNPTYNVGPEATWMNPAELTGVKSIASTIGVGGLIPVANFNTQVSGAGVASVLPSLFVVAPVFDQFRLGLSVFSPLGGPDGFGGILATILLAATPRKG